MKIFRRVLGNPIFWIFIFALILRVYKLGAFPVGLHIDEAKVGWNALSILKTGLDDHLKLLSLYYNSFGDFRPSGIFYFTIPSIAIFGRSIFAIRFPVALFGALMVFPIYLLTNLLTKNKNIKLLNLSIGHIAAFLMAISPWQFELSRATNEVIISTFFALFSIYFFVKLIETHRIKFAVFSIFSIIISYLLYHAIRFLAPLTFLVIIISYFKGFAQKKLLLYSPFIAVCLLTLFFSTTQEGVARLDQVSIFNSVDTNFELQQTRNQDLSQNLGTRLFDNKWVIYFKRFVTEYGDYLSADFLVGADARPYRFTTPGTGLITYVEAILFLFGIFQIVKNKESKLVLFLLLIAPLPAALTTEDSPNMSRAFLMIPLILMIESFGFYTIIHSYEKYKKKVALLIAALLILNFSYFMWMYFEHSFSHRPFLKDFFVDSPTYRNVGAVELVEKLDSLKGRYDKIIITNFPDNPYPWYAFFTGKDPADFNKTYKTTTNEKDYGNIVFSEEKCPSDNDFWKYNDQNILVVDSWECDYESQIEAGSPIKVLSKITRRDGTEVYILLERDWSKEFPEGILNKIKQTSKK